MTLILCADERNGLLFNHRRLSRDSALCAHILELCGEKTIWMNAYSASIFPPNTPNIRVCENFTEEVKSGECCFVENTEFSPILQRVKRIVLYRYNRSYPSDTKLPDDLFFGRELVSTVDFAGSSHSCITQEVYE